MFPVDYQLFERASLCFCFTIHKISFYLNGAFIDSASSADINPLLQRCWLLNSAVTINGKFLFSFVRSKVHHIYGLYWLLFFLLLDEKTDFERIIKNIFF